MRGVRLTEFTKEENESIKAWDTRRTSLDEDSLEGEDIYSVAFGFYLGRGHHPDRAHSLASSRLTIL